MSEVLDQEIVDETDAAQRVIQIIGVAPKKITTEDQYEDGCKWLANVTSRKKKIEAFFESLKKPIRLALKTVQDKEKAILEPLEKEQTALKSLTGAFFMKRKAEADEKQRIENEKHENKVNAAIAAGKPAETVAPPKMVNQLATTVKSADGGPTMTMRLIKNWRIKLLPDLNQQHPGKIYRSDHPALAEIPDAAWVLDTTRANAIAKSGMSPALELYDVPSQAVSG